jgi:hypothetical protein
MNRILDRLAILTASFFMAFLALFPFFLIMAYLGWHGFFFIFGASLFIWSICRAVQVFVKGQ